MATEPAELSVYFSGKLIGHITVRWRAARERHGVITFTPEFEAIARPCYAEAERWGQVIDEAIAAGRDEEADEATTYYSEEIARLSCRVAIPELHGRLVSCEFALNGDNWAMVVLEPMTIDQYVRDHPPHCITRLHPTAIHKARQAPGVITFEVGCPCGERAVYPLVHRAVAPQGRGEAMIVSPLGMECPRCGQVLELFSSREHGSNGEKGYDANVTGTGPRTRFPCPRCGEEPLVLMPSFSYQSLDDWHPGDQRDRPQDYFGWFHLEGRCSRCGQGVSIADLECR